MSRLKQMLVFLFLLLLGLVFYFKYLFVFFTQDDFVMISYFHGSNLIEGLTRFFLPTSFVHWRPVDNLFYFLSGNLFGKNYFFYHLVSLFIHVLTAFLIFKIGAKLFKSEKAGLIASIIYLSSSAFFHSIVWISGNTVTIGFLLFTIAFYLLITNKKTAAFVLLMISALASEAMLFGVLLFWLWNFIFNRKHLQIKYLLLVSLLVCVLGILIYFSSSKATGDYALDISEKTLYAAHYYTLRILGFGESGGDRLATIVVIIALLILGYRVVLDLLKKRYLKYYFFAFTTTIVGLFPFILIPNHLAAYYVAISIFGYAMVFAIASQESKYLIPISVFLFVIASYLNFGAISKNSWVIKRAEISKNIISAIEKGNSKKGTFIRFGDSNGYDSKEAYFALGGGKALDFWFKDKNYQYCFKFQSNCY